MPTHTAPLTLLCKEGVWVREGGHEGRGEAICVREVVQVRHREDVRSETRCSGEGGRLRGSEGKGVQVKRGHVGQGEAVWVGAGS